MSERKTRIDKGVPRTPKTTVRLDFIRYFAGLDRTGQDRFMDDCRLVQEVVEIARKPKSNGAGAQNLDVRCDTCAGTGFIDAAEMRSCAECSGSGKRLVAGARLEQRGTHLEVR